MDTGTIVSLVFNILLILAGAITFLVKIIFKNIKRPHSRNWNILGVQKIEQKQEEIETKHKMDLEQNKVIMNTNKNITKLFIQLNKLQVDQNNLNKAFLIYVENNGAKPETKKIIKELLSNEK
ncbi:hypothetical protein ACW95P_03190 [Candidatus Mycoplasma pogonae]